MADTLLERAQTAIRMAIQALLDIEQRAPGIRTFFDSESFIAEQLMPVLVESEKSRRCRKCGGCEVRDLPASCDCDAPDFSGSETVAPEELKRLREIEHHAWHLLDDSEERVAEGEVVVSKSNYEELSKLLPEDHP